MPQQLIADYFESLPTNKRSDLETLHERILYTFPDRKLWFLDGKNESGKAIAHPNIGYGFLNLKFASGKTRDFYQVGISANNVGISVYIMGIPDKGYLQRTYASSIGKARITGYCIQFKKLEKIHLSVLDLANQDGFHSSERPHIKG
jgi:hypothetical protein